MRAIGPHRRYRITGWSQRPVFGAVFSPAVLPVKCQQLYPGASCEPVEDGLAERINAVEREELRLLIADVLAEDAVEDRREAWQVAMADPYAALECLRALFHAKTVFHS